jgi:hypothetical protein
MTVLKVFVGGHVVGPPEGNARDQTRSAGDLDQVDDEQAAGWRRRMVVGRLMRGCPLREPCGCGGARCHRGDHDGELLGLEVCRECTERVMFRALPGTG